MNRLLQEQKDTLVMSMVLRSQRRRLLYHTSNSQAHSEDAELFFFF